MTSSVYWMYVMCPEYTEVEVAGKTLIEARRRALRWHHENLPVFISKMPAKMEGVPDYNEEKPCGVIHPSEMIWEDAKGHRYSLHKDGSVGGENHANGSTFEIRTFKERSHIRGTLNDARAEARRIALRHRNSPVVVCKNGKFIGEAECFAFNMVKWLPDPCISQYTLKSDGSLGGRL